MNLKSLRLGQIRDAEGKKGSSIKVSRDKPVIRLKSSITFKMKSSIVVSSSPLSALTSGSKSSSLLVDCQVKPPKANESFFRFVTPRNVNKFTEP